MRNNKSVVLIELCSVAMALRLSDAFGTAPHVWIGMQANYDLAKAARKRRVRIARLAA